LVSNSFSLDFLLGGLFIEESGFSLLFSGNLFSGKVGLVELFNVNGRNINLGGSSNNVSSIDSS